jgi:ubiquinone/menaquinone biosynthesis C-methylase UbiE
MADLNRVEKGFDRLAPVYDLMVRLFAGSAIPRSQTVFLDIAEGRRILVVGGGTGLFLEELLHSIMSRAGRSTVHVVNLDLSSRMLQRAEARVRRIGLPPWIEVEHRHCGLAGIGRSERFDLVCTHYFLDLFAGAELDAVMARLDQALAAGGQWMFSDFDSRRSAQVKMLYRLFGLACGLKVRQLANFQRRFLGLGYEPVQEETDLGGLLRSALYTRAASHMESQTRENA